MNDIPKDLILNWDQKAMEIVPLSSWTMEKCGSKKVKISASDDKQQFSVLKPFTSYWMRTTSFM